MLKQALLALAVLAALTSIVYAAAHGSVPGGSTCTYGLKFNQGCNTVLLATGQNL